MTNGGKFMISYAHERDGTFYLATVSEIDGAYEASWSVTKSNQKRTKDGVVTRDQFKRLWNTIVNAPVFHRSIPEDGNAGIDPVRFHVVGVAFERDGDQGVVTHLVPVTERDPEMTRWLRTLSATYNTKCHDH